MINKIIISTDKHMFKSYRCRTPAQKIHKIFRSRQAYFIRSVTSMLFPGACVITVPQCHCDTRNFIALLFQKVLCHGRIESPSQTDNSPLSFIHNEMIYKKVPKAEKKEMPEFGIQVWSFVQTILS